MSSSSWYNKYLELDKKYKKMKPYYDKVCTAFNYSSHIYNIQTFLNEAYSCIETKGGYADGSDGLGSSSLLAASNTLSGYVGQMDGFVGLLEQKISKVLTDRDNAFARYKEALKEEKEA